MSKDKQFVRGTAKMKEFDSGGYVINFSVNVEDIAKIAEEQGNKGWVNLTMSKRRNKDDYDNTHYIYVNEFVPEKQGSKPAPKNGPSEKEDLPF